VPADEFPIEDILAVKRSFRTQEDSARHVAGFVTLRGVVSKNVRNERSRTEKVGSAIFFTLASIYSIQVILTVPF